MSAKKKAVKKAVKKGKLVPAKPKKKAKKKDPSPEDGRSTVVAMTQAEAEGLKSFITNLAGNCTAATSRVNELEKKMHRLKFTVGSVSVEIESPSA